MRNAWQIQVLTLSMVLVIAAPDGAQQPPSPPPQEDVLAHIRRRAEIVVVPVTVKDSSGRLVHGIGRDEFRIFEDDEEQELVVFSADAFPLSAVILIDNELPRSAAEKVETSIAAIAGGLAPDDEATVMLFDQVVSDAEPLTSDNDELHARLKRIKLNETFPGAGSAAMTGGPRVNQQSQSTGVPRQTGSEPRKTKNLYDAVWAAGQRLRHLPRERRKIIFLISDGRNSRDNQFNFETTLQLLLAADIAVYAISVDERALRTGGDLKRYADFTGGDVFLARSR
ncbi:MAG: VWA domain-containing protein, partial [Candidatus Acidiferrales bacterium]